MEFQGDISKKIAVLVRPLKGVPDQVHFTGLLDQSFPVLTGGQFLDDFPVWDERHGVDAIRLGAFVEGTLAAVAGARMAKLRKHGSSEIIGLIGAVATLPKFRKQGLASRLVQDLENWILRKNGRAAFLFGSEHALYSRLGYALSGEQRRISLGKLKLGSVSHALFSGWNPAIMRELRTRPLGIELSADDEGWVAAHKNVVWYWCGSASAPRAYAAVGKGMDLGGLVHEWGGEPEVLRSLLSHLAQISPDWELLGNSALFSRYGIEVGESEGIVESLCMAKSYGDFRIPADLWFWGLDGV